MARDVETQPLEGRVPRALSDERIDHAEDVGLHVGVGDVEIGRGAVPASPVGEPRVVNGNRRRVKRPVCHGVERDEAVRHGHVVDVERRNDAEVALGVELGVPAGEKVRRVAARIVGFADPEAAVPSNLAAR